MRITYDAEADAAYLYLAELIEEPETRRVTSDIYMDFDEVGRLVGIEVLDASKRLDLGYLTDLVEKLDHKGLCWHQLRREVVKRKRAGVPIETRIRHVKNWIEKVGDDYVVVRSERSGNLRKITRQEIEDSAFEKHIGKQRIILALREIGRYA